MRGHRSRGNLRGGGRAGFQWRRNDRANPGPSRPANPGPNNVSMVQILNRGSNCGLAKLPPME